MKIKSSFRKIFLFKFVLLILVLPFFSAKAVALLDPNAKIDIEAQDSYFQTKAGFASADQTTAAEIIATVIKTFIGLLGIIFVVLIVYSGYNWMTAAGDEGKITKAKDTIQRAIIGLIIVLAAYSITYFVFSNLDSVVDSNGGGGVGP